MEKVIKKEKLELERDYLEFSKHKTEERRMKYWSEESKKYFDKYDDGEYFGNADQVKAITVANYIIHEHVTRLTTIVDLFKKHYYLFVINILNIIFITNLFIRIHS